MKKITFILLLLALNFGYGQVKLAELAFETPGGYTTSIPEFTDYIPGPGTGTDGRDYFIRTDGSNTRAEIYTNKQGFYFAAQDIDGEDATLPVYLTIENINISGYSNIEFRVHLAEDDATDGNENWDNTLANNDYVHINYDIDNSTTFENLLWVESSSTGLSNEPSIDTDFNGTGDGAVITNAFTQFTQSIVATGSLLDIQIVFNLDAEEEDIAIDSIEIWGTLVPCAASITWDLSGWSNVTGPGLLLDTEVTLNTSYDTSIDGSFGACNLVVSNGATLNIADNYYVEVQNDITVDAGGSIIVQPYGAIIQKNDFGSLTNNGVMSVDKITAPMDAWYEYTYWSSPVSNETIAGAIVDSNPSRRYIFDGRNFLDATAETANNNATVAGQDDIDDDGNDWQPLGGTTIMQAGVGYATTLTQFAYDIGFGTMNKTFRFTFTGDFHYGVYNAPIFRNDSETNDNNWNLIGNPYPSAIDVDLFLAANTNIETNTVTNPSGPIDGAIYIWSQDTPPSAIANGNQVLNFSDSDFAIINGSTEIAGGDGVPPNRFIPSGQAFFVTYSDSATPNSTIGDISEGSVVFSNSMRVANGTANSQFFKGSNSKKISNTSANKLWLNLTSDGGAFNQTAIAYIEGATNNFDGSYFDALKPAGIVTTAILYTNIEGSNKKLAIQGKAVNSICVDEVINLGFKTNTDESTFLKLSIDHLQGDFLTENTIFLKDNLLNKLHNLSAGDYTFTSEIGEFNDRFEIVFNANALSTNDIISNQNSLSIVELDNDQVQFNVTNNLKIKSVRVFDLLGRQLYHFKGQNSTETYRLSNLSSTVYIAKVTLSNGSVITKKSVKK